jgi:hypothetical protein
MVAVLFVVMLAAAALPALAADQPADVKTLQERVKSLQDANVVMKEDLAKTQLQLAEMAAQNGARAEASKHDLADLAKQLADLRQQLADERAAHEAELAKAKAEAERQGARAREHQKWMYILGGVAVFIAASQ